MTTDLDTEQAIRDRATTLAAQAPEHLTTDQALLIRRFLTTEERAA